jgi:transposase
MKTVEREIRKALDLYSDEHVPGVWAKSIIGIGPVIAAGLLAHIEIERAPTVGHIWAFAGLDPTRKWGRKGRNGPTTRS